MELVEKIDQEIDLLVDLKEEIRTVIKTEDDSDERMVLRYRYVGFLDDNRECSIPCLVLLIVGEKDNTGKVRAYNKAWAKRTGHPFMWISNAAHNSNVDNPIEVNEIIMEFIRSIEQ